MKRLMVLMAASLFVACNSRPAKELTLVTYNVGVFSKYTEDSTPQVAELARRLGADCLALNELDSCNRRHAAFQLKELAGLLGWQFHFARAFGFAGGAYGNGVASPSEILHRGRLDLPCFDGSEERCVAVAETADAVFASVHLDFAGEEAAVRQSELINTWFTEHYKGFDKPVFLMGDMNSRPDSPAIAELGRCWERLSVTDDTYSTEDPHACIDYIFALRSAARVAVLSSSVIRSAEGIDVPSLSDHFPVICRVRILR